MPQPAIHYRTRALGAAAALALAVAATVALYEPYRPVPFAIQDFSEFLPLLHRPSLAEQWSGFVHYYASQGRWNLLAYASLILKWSVFGANTVGWQWTRFFELWLIILGTYVILRRFGADIAGAAGGAALFAVAGPAVTAWMRQTMGEPLGFCFLLAAVYVAQGYNRTERWRRNALLIACCIALALLTKEMLIAFVPFVIAVACCVEGPKRLVPPRNDERTRWLVGASTFASVAILIPVAHVARTAPPGNFASQYASRPFSAMRVLSDLILTMMPAGATATGVCGRLRAAPNVMFLCLMAAGAGLLWWRGRQRAISHWQVTGWAGLALLLPVCVVAAYQPWSVFQDFYGFPYVLGAAMILAGAITAANSLAPGWAGNLVTCCAIAMLTTSGMRAVPVVGRTTARREVDAAVAAYVGTHPTDKSVVVIAHGFAGGHWPGTGPTLGRYAAAMYPGADLAAFRDDTTCVVPSDALASDDRIGFAIRYADDCGPYDAATVTFRARYEFVTLRPPAIRADSIRIDVCDRTCVLKHATSAAE